jgi:hypothetical protein
MIQTDHNQDEDNNDRRLGRERAPPKRFKDYEVYVTVEEEDEFMLIGGTVKKNAIFSNCPWTNSE